MATGSSRAVARAAIIVLQLVYINVALALAAWVYELLPRILNVLVGMFVIPIVLLVLFNVLAGRVLARAGIKLDNPDAPVTVMGIVSITLWLGLGLGNYLEVLDYPWLKLGAHAEGVDPAAAAQHDDALSLSFSAARLATPHIGLERHSSQVKSGDVVTKTYHDYVAIPVVWDGWDASQPVSAWLCVDSSGLERRPPQIVIASAIVDAAAHLRSDGVLHTLAIRDPATRSNCEAAIEQSVADTGALATADPLVLRTTELARAELLERAWIRFLIFLAVWNVLGLAPALFIRLGGDPP